MSSSPRAHADAGVEPISVGALVAGRYRVTARIGAGGMATIYRAVDESLERDVAIKVLHAHLADDVSLLARFRAEARAAAGLLHPHIVNVFDQGVADLPYIVMEFVDGPSLREVLLSRGRLTPPEALSVVEPVAAALARAHAAGVVHRDIKPENVLIAADGTVKVADFGIARAVAETSHTATGTLIGSVHYLAPELMGGAEATARSDQYSAGIVLFELITGRKPLPAETPMAVAMRHAREKIPPVRDFVSDAPAAVDGVIAKATATVPTKRYSDMQAMATALRAAVPGGPEPVTFTSDDNHTMTITIDEDPTVVVNTSKPRRSKRRTRTASGGVMRPASWRRTAAWALVTLALLTAGAFALWNWVLVPVVDAPQLVGLTQEQAAAEAEEAGLLLAVADPRSSLEVPKGRVLLQDPPAWDDIRRGATITITPSSGPAQVVIPDLVGKPGKTSVRVLEGAPNFFEVSVVRVFSDKAPKGEVVAQAPAAERTVLQGREIALRVSKGVEQVKVPGVVGRDADAAADALAGAKLALTTTEVYSDDVPDGGTVISQSVKPGTVVDKGATVELTVSKGPITFALDNYVGQGLTQAKQSLAALGLEARVVEQARPVIGPTRQGEYGRVEAQSPPEGTTVERGEVITLYTFSAAADAQAEAEG